MKACKIDIDTWENAAGDRARWGQKDKQGIEQADSERGLKAADKRARRKLSASSTTNTPTGLHLLCLQQELPIADWPLQPHKTLQVYNNRGLNLF